MPRRDLTNARLMQLIAGALLAIAAWFAVSPWLPQTWRVPGSPALYLTGVAGAALLVVGAAFALAKRGGRSRDPLAWFNAHVLCASLGAVLIAIHSGGFLRRPPALLLAAIVALAALGVWARIRGARSMAATFGAKAPRFDIPDSAARARLRSIVAEKRALLERLDPGAQEGTFSVTLAHVLRAPRLGLAYQRLARAEARLIGARRAVGLAQAWWRPLHMALAWIFVLGVVIHIAAVTFFAGYVAGGAPITWWHLAEW
ncbi:MAG: hypothetical protein M0015_10430 [Betaproteobacteria bacterium]|nr:hypothetical protein [Betaproteobacteria bacterium]